MLVFAHRGASLDKAENTLSAFEEAITQGAHGIELDVIQVEDEFFVLHDRRLERTTNGQGLAATQSKAYLQSLVAGDGLPIPTLAQVIELVADRCWINIELKFISNPKAFSVYLTQALIGRKADQIIVSSFHYGYLVALQGLLAGIKLGAVTASYDIPLLNWLNEKGFWSVHQCMDVVDPTYVERAHDFDLTLLVYTVDEPDDWHMLQNWKVDGLFTNKPGVCRQYLSG